MNAQTFGENADDFQNMMIGRGSFKKTKKRKAPSCRSTFRHILSINLVGSISIELRHRSINLVDSILIICIYVILIIYFLGDKKCLRQRVVSMPGAQTKHNLRVLFRSTNKTRMCIVFAHDWVIFHRSFDGSERSHKCLLFLRDLNQFWVDSLCLQSATLWLLFDLLE